MKYWNNKGKQQELLEIYSKQLIPDYGDADTPEGEALRSIRKINYDVFNNGACNIVRQTEEIDDYGDYYTEYEIERWWEDFFEEISEFASLDADRLKRKIIYSVQHDTDNGLSDMLDDYIDHIILKVDNQLVTK